ncbi:MAG: helix-turn-helix transcriptional regulator [Lachnospiraceae bacterium]|nr:helix-turn-helix transcriptional regulator [Lachnospiraceae bacterium]
MKLPDKIIKHRKANGWSQEDFAEKLNVSRQAISRWENGTAQPDAQNILQISKLFHVTTDYLLNDDYESDRDIPAVKTATEETETLFLKKKHLHLVSAICFTISVFCAMLGAVNSTNDTQLALSGFILALCAGNAIAQFVLYVKKR